MKIKPIIKRISLTSIAIFSVACNSFLDELPDNRTEIDSPEKVKELLTSAYPTNGLYMNIAETMSDNASYKPTSLFEVATNTSAFHWEDNDDTGLDTASNYWNACYTAISVANQSLESLEKLGSGIDYNYLRGEALVARAYAHFMLGWLWCKAYNPSTASVDLGLPYVKSVEKNVFQQYSRLSLEEYYKQIEQDLEQGILLIENSSYTQPKFHFTKEAAHAFATRFYLYKGDFDKVKKHADAVLPNSVSAVLPVVRDMSTFRSLGAAARRQRYSSVEESTNLLIMGSASGWVNGHINQKYGLKPSETITIFSDATHPLRTASWINTVGRLGMVPESQTFHKFQLYYDQTSITGDTGVTYAMNVQLSYDELIINRIEANVMLGNYDLAATDLKALLSKKSTSTEDISSLSNQEVINDINNKFSNQGTDFEPYYTLSSQQRAWLQAIINTRRVIFIQEGLRWLDNKRLGMKITHQSDRGTFELLKSDPRRELQIPKNALMSGIQQNPR